MKKFHLSLCLIFASAGLAQQHPATRVPSIDLGGANLHLGQSLEDVTKLAGVNHLRLEGPIDKNAVSLFAVYAGDGKGLGTVTFRKGRLVEIRRSWSLGEDPERTLYYIVQHLVDEGYRNCALRAGQKDDAQAESKFAWISCGPKDVEISVFNSHQTKTQMRDISEILSE